jgi:hypothetical protein
VHVAREEIAAGEGTRPGVFGASPFHEMGLAEPGTRETCSEAYPKITIMIDAPQTLIPVPLSSCAPHAGRAL